MPRRGRPPLVDRLHLSTPLPTDPADLLISLHVNGFPSNSGANGYETSYTGQRSFGTDNRRFATMFEEFGHQMRRAGYAATARQAHDDATANIDWGTHLLPHMVLIGPAVLGQVTPSAMPGVIGEPLLLTNAADAAFLLSPEGQEVIVAAYEWAIMRYFDRDSPGMGCHAGISPILSLNDQIAMR